MQYTLAKKRNNTLLESKSIGIVEELKLIIKKKKKEVYRLLVATASPSIE